MKKDSVNNNVGIVTENESDYSEWTKTTILKIKPEQTELITLNSKIKILQLNFISKIGVRNKISYRVSGTQSPAWEIFSRIG